MKLTDPVFLLIFFSAIMITIILYRRYSSESLTQTQYNWYQTVGKQLTDQEKAKESLTALYPRRRTEYATQAKGPGEYSEDWLRLRGKGALNQIK